MKRFVICACLLVGGLSACMPRNDAVAGVTVTPMLIKVSEAAPRGGQVTIQGRYLGGPATSNVRLGATADGKGGYLLPKAAVSTWTDSTIVFTVPSDAPEGAGWMFVEVAGMQSTGLPFSVSQ